MEATAPPPPADALFLGFDSSTQSLSATAIGADLEVVAEAGVNFDADLPGFGTSGGVHRGDDGLSVTSPTALWVAAFDLVLERLKEAGFPFGRVVAISGSGQQHGSVYWAAGAGETLAGLDPAAAFAEQLGAAFAVADSPIWMDSSTSAQCRALEEALGGAQRVAELTGSRAYERFTGNQVAKVAQGQPGAYARTAHISLVSSFAASLLRGEIAPIDASDGSGMNLMDIRSKDWVEDALEACAPGLRERLGRVVPSHADLGSVSPYLARRYGFDPGCRVVAFSGDNPCSLAGLRLGEAGDVAISLGTSDTVFGTLAEPRPSADEGHIFASPVDPEGYMALVCYKNGSLTREAVRDRCCGGSWEAFEAALGRTPPGNGGRVGFFLKEPEITPPILRTGRFLFDPDGTPVEAFPPDSEVRAVVEGQFLSMRLHGANIGIEPRRVLATGGASANRSILQVMADVFGVPVHTAERPNSASLGAAYRALHGWACNAAGGFVPFAQALSAAPDTRLAASPVDAAHGVYQGLIDRYAEREREVVEG